MPIFASCVPRTMLPPPITTPTDAPSFVTATTSSQRRWTVSKSKPNPFSPARASPDNLIRTRGYLSADKPVSGLADLEPGEPPHLNVLASLCRHLLHQVTNRSLVIANPRLVQQR